MWHYNSIQLFSYLVDCKVFAVFFCFIALLVKANPDWSQVFIGYIPNSGLFQTDPDAIYIGRTPMLLPFLLRLLTLSSLIAIGILGATVMPHALFLGSSMATQDRVSEAPQEALTPLPPSQTTIRARIRRGILKLFSINRAERETSTQDYRTRYGERQNNSLTFIRQHLSHGIIDIVTSLTVIAVPINSASVFFLSCLMNCRSLADKLLS
jgi:metal iron transporter